MNWRIRPAGPADRRGSWWLFPAAAAATAGAGAVLFALLGVDPLEAYRVMGAGAFGSAFRFSEVVLRSIPLILTGLAVALAATMLLWNIGCEGQLVWGGIGAAGTALFLAPHLPEALVLPAVAAAGAAAGALWAMVPALLRTRAAVNEILSSLLLNYVAIIVMEHLYFGPWRNPEGYGFPGTAQIPEAARLPHLWGTRVHPGLFAALALALALFWLLRHTPWGYRVRVTGQNPRAARYAGFRLEGRIVAVMAMSGALAGLAGMAEVSAVHYRLQQGLAVGYGYDGIIVAWLARLNPLAVAPAALFLAALIVGGEQLQTVLHLPSSISTVLEAVLLFALLSSEALTRFRIVRAPAADRGRIPKDGPAT